MKKLFSGILAFAIIIFIIFILNKSEECVEGPQEDRTSISFLVGEDKPGKNFFAQAEEYFSWNPMDKTDKIVKSCRSLEDIIYHLNNTATDVPWGTINIVLHGNVWTGLSMDITQSGHRATPKRLIQALLLKSYPEIKNRTMDSCTQINFYGCGIGKNPMVVTSLKTIFKTQEGVKPNLYISPDYVVFSSSKNDVSPMMMRASYWPYIFKEGYKPSQGVIAQALRETYPTKAMDWNSALDRKALEADNNTFHQSFNIPVVHTVIYPKASDRPNVSSDEEKWSWIASQEQLVKKIEEVGIEKEKFNWRINKIKYTHPDGSVEPAIKAIGMATILCVLETKG